LRTLTKGSLQKRMMVDPLALVMALEIFTLWYTGADGVVL
jgi:hypothetical protein